MSGLATPEGFVYSPLPMSNLRVSTRQQIAFFPFACLNQSCSSWVSCIHLIESELVGPFYLVRSNNSPKVRTPPFKTSHIHPNFPAPTAMPDIIAITSCGASISKSLRIVALHNNNNCCGNYPPHLSVPALDWLLLHGFSHSFFHTYSHSFERITKIFIFTIDREKRKLKNDFFGFYIVSFDKSRQKEGEREHRGLLYGEKKIWYIDYKSTLYG